MVGKGQPKKADEKVKKQFPVYLDSEQESELKKARDKESPDLRFGAYIRNAALNHADIINNQDRQ